MPAFIDAYWCHSCDSLHSTLSAMQACCGLKTELRLGAYICTRCGSIDHGHDKMAKHERQCIGTMTGGPCAACAKCSDDYYPPECKNMYPSLPVAHCDAWEPDTRGRSDDGD